MGCDIHLYTEVKVKGQWYCYGHPNVPRCYPLFAIMADVRNEDGEYHPVAKPKGLPPDCSVVTQLAADNYPDGHSHSWLDAVELVKLEESFKAIAKLLTRGNWEGSDLEHHYVGYLEGNSWAGFTRHPDDKCWMEDVRWVFWFDN